MTEGATGTGAAPVSGTVHWIGAGLSTGSGLAALCDVVEGGNDRGHLDGTRSRYVAWRERQQRLSEPDHDTGLTGRDGRD